MEAQLILSKFEVYETLCIQVKITKKKERKNAQNRKQNVYFLMHVCKYDIIGELRESTRFSCLTSIFKFRMQTAFQINFLLFSVAFIRYTEMD